MRNTLPRVTALLVCLIALPARAVDFELEDGASFSLYAELQFFHLIDEIELRDPDESLDDDPPTLTNDERGSGVSEFIDNGSIVGIAGERQLNETLRAYFQVEWDFVADEEDEEEPGLVTGESYVGIAGNFGRIQLGNYDGVYDDAILDPVDNFDYEGPTEITFSDESGDLLTYYSPEFNGFSFAVQTALKGDGAGINNDTDPDPDTIYPFVFSLSYESDLFTVSLGYDDRALLGDDADAQTGIAVAFDLEPFYVAIKHETIGDSARNVNDGLTLTGLLLVYGYENFEFSAGIQQISHDLEVANFREDRDETFLAASWEFGEDAILFAESGTYDRFEDEDDYTGIGLNVEF